MKVRWKRGAAPRFARSLRRARGYYGADSNDEASCGRTLLLFLLLILISSGGMGLLFAAAIIVSIVKALWSFLTSPTGIIIAVSAVACLGIVIAVRQWRKRQGAQSPPSIALSDKQKDESSNTDIVQQAQLPLYTEAREQEKRHKPGSLKRWQRVTLLIFALLDFAMLGIGFMVLLTSTSR